MSDVPPLIVTADLDEGTFAWFEDLRQSHFPRHRNRVPAHLTLFHALPGEHEQEIVQALEAACRDRRPIDIAVRGPWSLGRGVAYPLASSELEDLRNALAQTFSAWLTRQDQAPFRPHITVQNKAEPDDARLLLEDLQQCFEPFDISGEGLHLWRYLGGPWQSVARFRFTDPV